jgi:small subunit ribosomal protein S6
LRTYELVFIAQPDLDEEALNALTESLVQVITSNGGELIATEVLGRRRLAYMIGKWREGQYVMIHAKLERQAISELERSLKLSEPVLRHLLLRLDEVA